MNLLPHRFLLKMICPCRYIELAGNERSEFKARELKSIHIDAEGIFLKILVHKNYLNRLNLYNQVCIEFSSISTKRMFSPPPP